MLTLWIWKYSGIFPIHDESISLKPVSFLVVYPRVIMLLFPIFYQVYSTFLKYLLYWSHIRVIISIKN